MSRVEHNAPTRSSAALAESYRAPWLVWSSLALSVAGLAVSAYLTYEHFTDNSTLACSIGGVVDCAKVTTSAWSTFLGVPVALLGLLFFVVMIGLCLPRVWRSRAAHLDAARLGWATVGLGMALYLVREFTSSRSCCGRWSSSARSSAPRSPTSTDADQSNMLMTGISSVSTPSTAFSSGLAGSTVAT